MRRSSLRPASQRDAVAYFRALRESAASAAILLAVIVPFWTSYLLRVYAWQAILGEHGALNQALLALGLIKEPSALFIYNDFGVGLTLWYLYFPFAALALYAALEKFDFAQFNAARTWVRARTRHSA